MKLPPPAVVEAQVLRLAVVRDGTTAIAQRVQQEAQELAARRAHEDGTYAALIRTQPADPYTGVAKVVAHDRKSTWLEEGTGIYGPERRPIKPKNGRFLVFRITEKQGGPAPVIRSATGAIIGKRQPAKVGDLVFAKQVRGRPASWVMRDAAAAVAASIPGARFLNLRRYKG